jgi:hypothetical protein
MDGSNGEQQAVQVVQLMQQFLQHRATTAAAADALLGPDAAAASGAEGPSNAAHYGTASAMLQQLSAFPSTAMLLCLASAQHLQRLVPQSQENCSTLLQTSLASFSISTEAAERSLRASSNMFQSSHELLEDLVSNVCWLVAASCLVCWTTLVLRLWHLARGRMLSASACRMQADSISAYPW